MARPEMTKAVSGGNVTVVLLMLLGIHAGVNAMTSAESHGLPPQPDKDSDLPKTESSADIQTWMRSGFDIRGTEDAPGLELDGDSPDTVSRCLQSLTDQKEGNIENLDIKTLCGENFAPSLMKLNQMGNNRLDDKMIAKVIEELRKLDDNLGNLETALGGSTGTESSSFGYLKEEKDFDFSRFRPIHESVNIDFPNNKQSLMSSGQRLNGALMGVGVSYREKQNNNGAGEGRTNAKDTTRITSNTEGDNCDKCDDVNSDFGHGTTQNGKALSEANELFVNAINDADHAREEESTSSNGEVLVNNNDYDGRTNTGDNSFAIGKRFRPFGYKHYYARVLENEYRRDIERARQLSRIIQSLLYQQRFGTPMDMRKRDFGTMMPQEYHRYQAKRPTRGFPESMTAPGPDSSGQLFSGSRTGTEDSGFAHEQKRSWNGWVRKRSYNGKIGNTGSSSAESVDKRLFGGWLRSYKFGKRYDPRSVESSANVYTERYGGYASRLPRETIGFRSEMNPPMAKSGTTQKERLNRLLRVLQHASKELPTAQRRGVRESSPVYHSL